MIIPFAWQSIGKQEREAVAWVLSGDRPLVGGAQVAEFESIFAARVGAKHAIATASCTAALEASCVAVGLAPGTEAVTTPFTFTATANAPKRAGATVVFVDVSDEGYHMSYARAFARSRPGITKAIIPVHYAGVALDMVAMEDIAWSAGAVVIEDAAQAVGSAYPDGSLVGSRPDGLCCFSFGPEKVMTTGYGGMITTGDDRLAERLRMIIRQGLKRSGPFRSQVEPGMNCGMTEIQAAIGIVQLLKLDAMIARRRAIFDLYSRLLADVPGVDLPPWKSTDSNGALFPVRLLRRQAVINALTEAGIQTSVHYRPVHLHPQWRNSTPGIGSFPNSEVLASWILSLPMYPDLADEDATRVAEIVIGASNRAN